jgi:hypothetical protein
VISFGRSAINWLRLKAYRRTAEQSLGTLNCRLAEKTHSVARLHALSTGFALQNRPKGLGWYDEDNLTWSIVP